MKKKIKLSQWAKDNGLLYMTAWRMIKSGRFPLPIEQLETGTILVELPDEIKSERKNVIYARVSSHDQKEDLTRQINRLREFCAAKGIEISDEIKEIGSGLNGERDKFRRLLESDANIICEHKDRLTRFGFEYIRSALKAQERNIIIMNETESDMDLVQDFVDVVTSMCARIYGKRSAKNRAKRAIAAAEVA